MGTPFLSEIRIVSFNYPPKGWAFCNGQTLPINQNQALFSLLGTTYGGNGTVNFSLPNLQTCVPLHAGNGYNLGQSGGQANHTLILNELPSHNHTAKCSGSLGTEASPKAGVWAADNNGNAPYSPLPGSGVYLSTNSIGATGESQPHTNMAPYLVLSFCIALQGIFPSRN